MARRPAKRAAAEMDPPPPCHWITFCTTGPRPKRVRCAPGCETRARCRTRGRSRRLESVRWSIRSATRRPFRASETLCTGAGMPARSRMQVSPGRVPIGQVLLLHAWRGHARGRCCSDVRAVAPAALSELSRRVENWELTPSPWWVARVPVIANAIGMRNSHPEVAEPLVGDGEPRWRDKRRAGRLPDGRWRPHGAPRGAWPGGSPGPAVERIEVPNERHSPHAKSRSGRSRHVSLVAGRCTSR